MFSLSLGRPGGHAPVMYYCNILINLLQNKDGTYTTQQDFMSQGLPGNAALWERKEMVSLAGSPENGRRVCRSNMVDTPGFADQVW